MQNSPQTELQEYYCSYCNETYEKPPKEDWVICHKCDQWFMSNAVMANLQRFISVIFVFESNT